MYKIRVAILFLIFIIVFGCINVSADSRTLQFYLAPQVMNDVTGEIVVDVKVKNFTYVSENYFDEVKAISFIFTYDKDNFVPITDSKGEIEFCLDDNTLVKNIECISSSLDMSKGQIEFTYLSKNEKQITEDGVICRFKLKAWNVNKLWNSFDRYPLRFVPGTIFAVVNNNTDLSVKAVTDAEGIDTSVGGYNDIPSLIPSSINKRVKFINGNKNFYVDNNIVETDAVPYVLNDVLMIPLRFFADAIGMKIEWQSDIMLAAAYGEYKSLQISTVDNKLFINSALREVTSNPEEINGRTYIPADIIKSLYDNVEYKFDGETVEIFIP